MLKNLLYWKNPLPVPPPPSDVGPRKSLGEKVDACSSGHRRAYSRRYFDDAKSRRERKCGKPTHFPPPSFILFWFFLFPFCDGNDFSFLVTLYTVLGGRFLINLAGRSVFFFVLGGGISNNRSGTSLMALQSVEELEN